MSIAKIPFNIDTKRVIELLGKQLYQSPLALLRENTQNAYDAILLRRHMGLQFDAKIFITLGAHDVTVSDNGVGMTAEELRSHFWFAGSSSKNNDVARAAGVVGTFGIGAMANFGIAMEVIVETESLSTGARTRSCAKRDALTLNHDCIDIEPISPTGSPGTSINARLQPGTNINIAEATNYISEFASLVEIPILVNGLLVSGKKAESFVPKPSASWKFESSAHAIGSRLNANVQMLVSTNADVWIQLTNIVWSRQALPGMVVVRSGMSTLRTCRSGFGLAAVSVGSHYQFGGIADLLVLQPTAGREALTTESMQLLQSIIGEIEKFASTVLADLPESDSSTHFMHWVNANRRYDLCRNLRINISHGDRLTLGQVEKISSKSAMLLYDGSDQTVIARHGSDERPLLVLARSQPRKQCESQFLQQFCKIEQLEDNPIMEQKKASSELTLAERALGYRVESILDSDYFLKARVMFGKISHSLPILVTPTKDGVDLAIDPNGRTVSIIISLYEREFTAFGSMAKDFVRTSVFPRISEYVPSSTSKGAEAFLKMIRAKNREVFEYENQDLTNLSSIWADYADGKITMTQAVDRSVAAVRSSVQFVDRQAAARIEDIVPDVIENERTMEQAIGDAETTDAAPAITRLEVSSTARILTIPDSEPTLRGYRCFLAITDKAREEMGEFFLQPHRTSVVWSGQKALFIFMHHSGRFGLYYDLQTSEVIAAETGGKPSPTCTIVLQDRIYIPIPDSIKESFIPAAGERKRFEIRCEILRTEAAEHE